MELSGLKILVTGAGGFIGSHLADRLAEANEVVLVDDFSIGLRENVAQLHDNPNATLVEADICDREKMRELCDGIDLVFHLAISCLRTSLGHPWLSHDINGGGTLSVALAAREHGVKRFVYVSSSEVYGSAETAPMTEEHVLHPTTVYGASKLAGELYALALWRTYGMPVTVIRPFNTYGPREPYAGARAEVIPRFILQLLAGEPPIVYGDGSQTRDFTYVEDTVTGMVLAGACDELVGEVVNLAYGREVPIARIAELLSELVGKEVAPRFTDGRPGDVDRHYADVGKARRLLDFEAKVDIETGLARTLDWFRDNDIASKAQAGASSQPNWED